MKMDNLEGQIAWVTGASRGIGAAIAQALREHGVTVIGSDVESGPQTMRCDMRNPAESRQFAADIVDQHGALDILVNNAGILRRKAFVDFTDEDYDQIFETNVRGAFFAAQAAARLMIAGHRRGSIINISSVNASYAQPETALYCSTKGAIDSMTRAMAMALGRSGIRVNAIAPGTIGTDINRDRLSNQDTVNTVTQSTALGRLGVPDDIGPAVAFLASDAAAYITGVSLEIHGGWTLR